MKLLDVGLMLTLACVSHCVLAYSVKAYNGEGTTRIEACTLAKNRAQSPDEEVAHGRLIKTSRCDCGRTSEAKDKNAWHCMVETTHQK
ncbi:hypothetical protein SAMN05446935_4099 [Burkholderia sp. YR290]|jgi:hypothetical protein|nr:hypothetical protein SAMN05446935_4099 [Burkholderia sp. YR290]